MSRCVRVVPSLAAGLFAAAIAGASPVKEVHKTVALSPSGLLEISTFKGSVDVSVWDRAEAEISARIEPDGDDSDMARKVEKTEVRIDESGGGSNVRVESNYDHVHHLFSLFHWGESDVLPFVRYTIRMPATARLEIKDHKSNTKVAGLKSDLRVDTYKGSLQADGLEGAADIHTYKGEVHVAFAHYSKPSRFRTYKGSVDVRVPKDSRFDLDADGGRHGEIESDFAVVSRRYHSSRRSETIEGPVNGGGPTLSFESHKGTFRLKGV
jgi:hypothetical protein